MRSLSAVLDALGRPAYTGARRCLPCTVTNAAILAVGVLALARQKRRVPALALALGGSGTVWLRGYLIPYTPRYAPRLVASIPVLDELFHADGNRGSGPNGPGSSADASMPSSSSLSPSSAGRDDPADAASAIDGTADPGLADGRNADGGEAVLDHLLAAGVLVASGDGELSLDGAVRERWRAEMDSLGSLSDEELATEALAVSPAATDARLVDDDRPGQDKRWIALGNGDAIAAESWLSRPVAIAEVGAVRALADTDLAPRTRLAAARPLRTFLEACPGCGGAVAETTTAACCGGVSPRRGPQEVLACADCDERLFTVP